MIHILLMKYGSYVFIGYIINNYDFESDKAIERTCMQCKRCIMACPGSAIADDFLLILLSVGLILVRKGNYQN